MFKQRAQTSAVALNHAPALLHGAQAGMSNLQALPTICSTPASPLGVTISAGSRLISAWSQWHLVSTNNLAASQHLRAQEWMGRQRAA